MNTISDIRRALLCTVALPVLLAVGAVAPAGAQVMQLDEGTFEILVAGDVVGTESFTIRRTGVGATAVIVLQGRTSVSGAEIEPILQTSIEWEPMQYRRTLSGSRDEVVELITDGQRYTAITTSERGEGEREFRRGAFTAVLDADVAFLYHAVAARSDADVVTVLHPDQGRQARFRLEVVGTESYRLGTATLQVRRVRISAGEDIREILVDDRNRVMSVQIPGRDWLARRIPG